MTGASSKCSLNRSVSMVADVTMSFRSGRCGSSWREVAEQEVDVEAALVGLVDDQRVVAAQHPVALDLGQQDAVGHHLDPSLLADPVGEAHRVADRGAELGAQLLGDALGDRARRDAPRLGVADQPARRRGRPEAELGQLRALARPGLAGDDHHLMPRRWRRSAHRHAPGSAVPQMSVCSAVL